MKNLFVIAFVFLLPFHVLGAEGSLKKYRWVPKEWKPLPYLLSASLDKLSGVKPVAPIKVSFGDLAKGQQLLPSKGEVVARGEQMIGSARVAGSWTQTIFHPDGHIIYAAGEVTDNAPEGLLPRVKWMENNLREAEERAESLVPELLFSSRRFPTKLEIRKIGQEYQPYWRIEYLTKNEDQIRYLFLSDKGELLEKGDMPWDGADGRGRVYPRGPKYGGVQEEPLYGLVGDGMLNGIHLRVQSALNLDVRSPQLLFFYSEDDRRFDLAQAYYTVEKGFRWMKDHLNVELRHPIDIRVHVGDNGISNAAFYHDNTIYLGTGDGVTYRDLLKDPSVLVHEGMHAIIDAYAGLPSEGEGGSFNEGFADFFAAVILENPRMGEVSYVRGPYRRTLENNFKAYRDFTGGVYRNGSIIGGTFWDMRAQLGDEKLARLAFRTLVRLGKGAKFEDFMNSLVGASAGFLTMEEQNFVLETAKNRGWVVAP